MEAVILAGGLGSRLRTVVADLPKPMAPVKGRPFLEYQLDYWMAQGVERFILSVGYKKETIRAHFRERYRGVALTYAEEQHPLGTGGALLNAIQYLNNDTLFLVLNGDTYYEVPLAGLQRAHDEKSADMTLALHPLDVNDRYSGVRLDAASRIVEFQRRDDPARSRLVNGGVYLVRRHTLQEVICTTDCSLSLEDDVLPDYLKRGKRIFGYPVSAKFLDIGLPDDYRRAEKLFG